MHSSTLDRAAHRRVLRAARRVSGKLCYKCVTSWFFLHNIQIRGFPSGLCLRQGNGLVHLSGRNHWNLCSGEQRGFTQKEAVRIRCSSLFLSVLLSLGVPFTLGPQSEEAALNWASGWLEQSRNVCWRLLRYLGVCAAVWGCRTCLMSGQCQLQWHPSFCNQCAGVTVVSLYFQQDRGKWF